MPMSRAALLSPLLLTLALPAAAAPRTDTARETAAIRQVVQTMQDAWNRGDFRGYMTAFKNPDVTFVSGGRFQAGWQGTLDHYVRDYGGGPERRGTLRFYDLSIEMLAPDAAQLIGRYTLIRPDKTLEGINTRLFRKVGGKWVIALNHVSAYETPPPPKAE